MRKEVAKKAARWWRDVLKNPKYDNGGDGFAFMMMMLAADKLGQPTEEQLNKFEEALVKRLEDKEVNIPYVFGCDYGPDLILREAADEAGIPPLKFPWKTVMWIYPDGKVEVGYGYGAEPKEV